MSIDELDENFGKDPIDETEENVLPDDGDDEDPDAQIDEEETPDESGENGRIQAGAEEDSIQRKVGRGERAVLRAKEETRRAREEAQAVRRELESYRSERQTQNSRYEEEQRRQRYEFMSPEERLQHETKDRLDAYENRFRELEFRSWDNNDKAIFDQLAHKDKTAARLSSQIEREIAELRKQGNTVDRVTLYTYKVGQEVLRKRDSAETREKKSSSAKIQKQSSRPSNSQSNVSSLRKEKTYLDRLEGVTF